MSELVRVRANGREFNAGRALATRKGWEILDEPTHQRDGRVRPETHANGRRLKPKTTVAKAAEEKKKDTKAAVIDSESAPTSEGTDR